jgi:hypothetical protein
MVARVSLSLCTRGNNLLSLFLQPRDRLLGVGDGRNRRLGHCLLFCHVAPSFQFN